MKTRNKTLAIHCGLMLLTVWPLVHIALVKSYDVNPWKFAGWGMYSAPQLFPSIRGYGQASAEGPRDELRGLPPQLQPMLADFLRLRRGLRKLVKPDAIGRELLRLYPVPQVVTIEVVQPKLNRKTAMIEETVEVYVYRR